MLRTRGIEVIGIDPTVRLIEEASRRDPDGDYRLGLAEALPFADDAFDLVVSYLSLIDIPHLAPAIFEMARVLAPGGTVLIANLTSFSTASVASGWQHGENGERLHFAIDRYLDERAEQVRRDSIEVVNHHRPLSTYMQLLLGAGRHLTHFDEPRAIGGDQHKAATYNRVPYAFIMTWRKS